MRKPASILLLALSLHGLASFAQRGAMAPVDKASADAVLARSATLFPGFHHELEEATTHDKLIRQVIFVRQQGIGRGPAFAAPDGVIRIDLSYLEAPRPGFDDNRLVVVLYHEIGHLHYFETTQREAWTPENSEKAAFEYSLQRTRALAEKGDCGPLQSGLHFMLQRSQSDNLADPHVRALKRMVNEPLYAGYVAYAQRRCAIQPAPKSTGPSPDPAP